MVFFKIGKGSVFMQSTAPYFVFKLNGVTKKTIYFTAPYMPEMSNHYHVSSGVFTAFGIDAGAGNANLSLDINLINTYLKFNFTEETEFFVLAPMR